MAAPSPTGSQCPYTKADITPLARLEKKMKGRTEQKVVVLNKDGLPWEAGKHVAILYGKFDSPQGASLIAALGVVIKSKIAHQLVLITKTWRPYQYRLHDVYSVDSNFIGTVHSSIPEEEFNYPKKVLDEWKAEEREERRKRALEKKLEPPSKRTKLIP
jgi:hypothetical protein